MNLIEQFGPSWFEQKFRGSYFQYEGMPAKVINVTGERRSSVKCLVIPRINGQVTPYTKEVPYYYFNNVEIFNVPTLGWRSCNKGTWTAWISRNNHSYHRGLSAANIRVQHSDLTTFLSRQGISFVPMNDEKLCNIVLQPQFIPLRKGISLMLAGKIVSFAVSSTIAVFPGEDDKLVIKFSNKDVGTVDADGNINITFPFVDNYIKDTE